MEVTLKSHNSGWPQHFKFSVLSLSLVPSLLFFSFPVPVASMATSDAEPVRALTDARVRFQKLTAVWSFAAPPPPPAGHLACVSVVDARNDGSLRVPVTILSAPVLRAGLALGTLADVVRTTVPVLGGGPTLVDVLAARARISGGAGSTSGGATAGVGADAGAGAGAAASAGGGVVVAVVLETAAPVAVAGPADADAVKLGGVRALLARGLSALVGRVWLSRALAGNGSSSSGDGGGGDGGGSLSSGDGSGAVGRAASVGGDDDGDGTRARSPPRTPLFAYTSALLSCAAVLGGGGGSRQVRSGDLLIEVDGLSLAGASAQTVSAYLDTIEMADGVSLRVARPFPGGGGSTQAAPLGPAPSPAAQLTGVGGSASGGLGNARPSTPSRGRGAESNTRPLPPPSPAPSVSRSRTSSLPPPSPAALALAARRSATAAVAVAAAEVLARARARAAARAAISAIAQNGGEGMSTGELGGVAVSASTVVSGAVLAGPVRGRGVVRRDYTVGGGASERVGGSRRSSVGSSIISNGSGDGRPFGTPSRPARGSSVGSLAGGAGVSVGSSPSVFLRRGARAAASPLLSLSIANTGGGRPARSASAGPTLSKARPVIGGGGLVVACPRPKNSRLSRRLLRSRANVRGDHHPR